MTAVAESPSSTLEVDFTRLLAFGETTTYSPKKFHTVSSAVRSGSNGQSPELAWRLDDAALTVPTAAGLADFNVPSAVFGSEGLRRTPTQAYLARIDKLREFARQDGYSLNSDSEADFWSFVASEPHIRRGNLVLIDNGNLRAVWKDGHGAQLGLQFLGGGVVQHVIFKQRESGQPASRVAGRDTIDGVKRQIGAFDLESLLYE